jgi:predicted phage-related endonuclease
MQEPPRLYTIRRNENLCRVIMEAEAEFWGLLQAGVPPLPTDRADPAIYTALYGEGNGVTVSLDDAVLATAAEYAECKEQIKTLEEAAAHYKAVLLASLGENTAGMFRDGRVLKRYVTKYAARTQEIKAYETTTIRVLKAKK